MYLWFILNKHSLRQTLINQSDELVASLSKAKTEVDFLKQTESWTFQLFH